jgi:two-component system, cell cycle sensor histidine kinase PleC
LRELSTFIGDNPNINQEEFSRRVQSIRGVDEMTVSIAAAPDMVITLIDPMEGNQGALGLDYRTNKEQLPTVLRMIQTGSEMITGPVNLVQGGSGLILRAPVYLPDSEGVTPGTTDKSGQRLWGIVSLVLDYDQFLVKSGITAAADKYDIFIDIKNHSGNYTGSFIYGDKSLAGQDTVDLQFDFSFEDWILHARTKGGWPNTSPDQWQQIYIMTLVSLVLLGAIIYILRLSHTRKRAEQLLNSGIEALDDGFVMFDADDRLILCNDKYREIYDFPQEVLKPGTPYSEILAAWAKKQKFPADTLERMEWLDRRQGQHHAGETINIEQHLADGRVIKVSNHPLRDGGSVGLRVDVTELSQAKDAAEAANEAKTNFMNVLSHELRTPLTVILGVAKLSRNARVLNSSKALLAAHDDGTLPPAEVKMLLDDMFAQLANLMDRMIQSGEHLLNLINEMLDIAKIESGSLVVKPTHCKVSDIVDPAIQQLRILSSNKGLGFEVVQEAETVFADKVRSQQILINLIGNAIKFTEVGTVRLVVKTLGDMVRFEVHDSGDGIPEAELDSIFGIFYQIDSTSTRREGGTGLGLAISRSLAELQNGSITVSSKIGEGSCFVMTLPRSDDVLLQ